MPVNRLAIITFLDGGGNVDNSLPGGGHVDNSLPWYPGLPGQGLPTPPNRPDNSLPPGAVTLPVFPWDPTIDNSLPGQPGRPDNSLPGGGNVDNSLPRPGKKYIVKWLACKGLILVPDNSLPSGPPTTPGQGLPPTAQPK